MSIHAENENFSVRAVDGLSAIGEAQWSKLASDGNPFLNWHFLHALESSGSVAEDNGWLPQHLCLYQDNRLIAAAPAYLKKHSRGEFVFDWAWADAYHRNGLPYYPKLLTAVPWTPVSGPRLLVDPDASEPHTMRKKLTEAAIELCAQYDLSSWHCNFIQEPDSAALDDPRLLIRKDFQFHWHNQDFTDFEHFLSTLKAKKRKNIRQERRQVTESGVHFKRKTGADLSDGDIRFIFKCYKRTFHAYGNHPALTLECFRSIIEGMPEQVLAILAFREKSRLAMSLSFLDRQTLYGRYWGSVEDVPGLHFETAYYQGIEYSIEKGLLRFESGAQGEHKLARGFEPVSTSSAHYIRHEVFRRAIGDYLKQEEDWLRQYRGNIDAHSPFRCVTGS